MRGREIWVVLAVVFVLSAIIIPVPAFLLDILLTLAITFSLSVLILTFFIKNPLEFSSFPSILLLGTLMRLSLNIAAARRILLHGHEGTHSAGKVIEAFGKLVAGGDVVVGLIVFLIFIVINFIVITKGAERISEVAARFTLDALPGKQMAIDADLNAGLITEEEAKRRRKELEKEASFYAAMDGASKFIRGDAIAALIILFLSLVGGLIVGIVLRGMDFSQALRTYTILSIGEGLASQIPALLLSTAAGVLTTKMSSEENLGEAITEEFVRQPKALLYSAGVLGFTGLVPGLPTLPFLLTAGGLLLLYYALTKSLKEREIKELEKLAKEKLKEKEQEEEELIPQPDPISLEIGYALIPMVDENQGGQIPKKIKNLRKQLAKEYGVIIPLVHIRDNLKLKPSEYRILIKGIEVDRYEIMPGHYLAVDLGNAKGKIEGIETYDPAFKIKAYWIEESKKEEAQKLGYMVVDPETVLITHLSEVIKRNLHELLTRNEVMELVELLSKKYPKVVKEIVPEQVPLSVLHRVLQNLLREGIPVNDLLTILETLADYIDQTKDPDLLTEYVRQALSKRITRMYMTDGTLYAIALSPKVEAKLIHFIKEKRDDEFIDFVLNKLLPRIKKEIVKFAQYRAIPVLLTSGEVRRFVRKTLEPYLPELAVLSYNELEKQVNIKILGIVDED
ncbi:MAG: flagellar biosynthesis protein FlhA [Aquificae bacterium]|nr:flagellar biosynthesis protein FlhA [Aquificota bacterium]